MKIKKNVCLKDYTWMKVGGFADSFYRAENLAELVAFIKQNKEIVTVIGLGSNILVHSNGIRGVVIRLGKHFSYLSYSGNHTITVGGATLDNNLAKFALAHEISGFEFFIGIPGTIGGALAMNAGCYGSDTSSVLNSARVLNDKGEILNLTAEEIGYVYRGNSLPKNWIFIEGTFVGRKGNASAIKAKMDKIVENRKRTQPIRNKTCGSIFKNPQNYTAWQLIDEVGCRGMKLGGAEISNMHCNFVINNGNATADDIEGLCEHVRQKVKEIKGVHLEWEIVRIGG